MAEIKKSVMKIRANSTIGSQISRASAMLRDEKITRRFFIEGIGAKAAATAIIVATATGEIKSFKTETWQTTSNRTSIRCNIETDSEAKTKPETKQTVPQNNPKTIKTVWNVSFPNPQKNQSFASSCRVLCGKLCDLDDDEELVLRGAGQAIQLMVVLFSYVKDEFDDCETTNIEFKNTTITNPETNRRNRKTLMSFTIKKK